MKVEANEQVINSGRPFRKIFLIDKRLEGTRTTRKKLHVQNAVSAHLCFVETIDRYGATDELTVVCTSLSSYYGDDEYLHILFAYC